jgi:hypothetical protein
MPKNIRPLSDVFNTADWLNAVRNQQGSDYQHRVPEATQANVSETVENLWDYTAARNQFVDALVNQIGLVLFRNSIWQNPLSQFKIGMLEQGETIEEVMNGLLQATDYDFDRDELEKELFGNHPVEVQTSFHKVNRKDRYNFTVNMPGLRFALLNNQLGSFMTNLMSTPQTSDQWDEYLLMMNLFREYDKAEAYHNVKVPDVSDQTSDSADSRFLLRRLREYSNTLPFISRLYNPAGMPVAAKPDELMLITTATADAAMDVEALAAAFNITKAEFGSRKIVVPANDFGIDGVQAVLTTNKFFVVADNLIETTSLFNPAKLTTNYWMHHWQVMSASRFAPLVMFNSKRESTVISVDVPPVTGIGTITIKDKAGAVQAANVIRGMLYDVNVSATTTGDNDAVELTLDSKTSDFTYINNNGNLFIAPDEQSQTLTINAISVDDPAFVASTTRTVVGDLIIPWPNPEVIPDSDLDGLEEVTPEKPGWDSTTNIITIPNQRGVQYKNGATNLNNGATVTVANGTPVTITAVARTGFELAAGVTASWTFTYGVA